ncbi:tripartite motif-containing protein 16-like [Scleropages formosus]|uniref:Tripartite motif-containing protein 16-like n=1 Tax=Scleropages formosus TaxID=113540 RepID=A0A8C9R7Q7_SCLFO|nr:tripartite motif-containing protein 16-like [Scleropages formosus]
MEEAGDLVGSDHISCSICHDILNNPVTIPCGHNYCKSCIKDYWDRKNHVDVHNCPRCRKTFITRPVLFRNSMVAEVVEKLKKARFQAGQPAGPGDVVCDACIETKNKAAKSCLVCLASYCEGHLQPHYDSPTFKNHRLINSTGPLKEKICSNHDKLLEVYCHTDQRCICLLCVIDEHKGHDTVPTATGRTAKQDQLEEIQKECETLIQERQQQLQELMEAVESLTCSAQAAVEDTESIFTEMIRSLEKRSSEVVDLIRAQEKAALSQAEELLERLELEVDELKKKNAGLEELINTEDHIYFFQSFQSLCAPPKPTTPDIPTIVVDQDQAFENLKKAVSYLKDQLEDVCKRKSVEISLTVNDFHILQESKSSPLRKVLQIPQSGIRGQLLQYACLLTLDPNTVHKILCLSEGNTVVTFNRDLQPYPDHPERFDFYSQVLCKEGLSGCCYWEVQWSGSEVFIAVAYKGISRKGGRYDCLIGASEKSWSLNCSPSSYSFMHSDKTTPVSGPSSSTIGVYLDHSAGTLSFYSVSDTMTLLHRVQTTFTEPLYPGFLVSAGCSVKLCSLG